MKPITIKTIIYRVTRVVSRSERSIRADIESLGVAKIGKRQRPQLYPHDTAKRVLKTLGYGGGR